ncbi:hypothetical protein PPERSA_08087 [Pseudocohnilembus persalinus]|uniref:Uncharacterized protein n=1 Tax=Pseudocohnilembus persalinus TaxID=266149 RepID=A0A0V0R3J7_PSEPJ|nr:hypothetical protein PPERSA_08087 [Pseudocohnilembus persalinus]|eukprot:KRX08776.1 hypothetical protein PPERSA_08087 [Pseudocohnilembus persalinus]
MKNSSFDENSLNNQYVRLEQSILSHVQNSKTPLELSQEVQMLKSHYYYSPLSIRIIENHKNEEVEWQNEPNSLTQTSLLSKRANKSKNIRNLKYAFLLTMLIYGSIGTLGYLGLLGRQKQTKFPVIIYDYFEPSNWQSLIVEISFCANLISVFPLFPYMGKAQLFAIIFEKQNQNDVYPQWAYHAYNLVLLTISIILQIQQVKINLIIGLVGTWIGFLSVNELQYIEDNKNK